MKALILYYTQTGHTLEAANAIAGGITDAGGEVTLVSVKEFVPAAIAAYDVLVVGSPCWKGSIRQEGLAAPVKKALAKIEAEATGKTCAGFSVHSGTGGENTVRSLGGILTKKGCQRYFDGPVARAGVPLSLWKGPAVQEKDLLRFRAFGAELAKECEDTLPY